MSLHHAKQLCQPVCGALNRAFYGLNACDTRILMLRPSLSPRVTVCEMGALGGDYG